MIAVAAHSAAITDACASSPGRSEPERREVLDSPVTVISLVCQPHSERLLPACDQGGRRGEAVQVSGGPESSVRKFYAAWATPDADTLGSFFAEDVVWVDGAQGQHRGVEAIKTELTNQLAVVGGVDVQIRTLVSSGDTVMVEHVDTFRIGDVSIEAVVMAVLEFGADGLIEHFREAFDLRATTDQMKAAGFGATH
jgi:limonene-1,2-epoxide hydrolase